MAKKRIIRKVALVALNPQSIGKHFSYRDWRRKTAFYAQSLDLPLYRRRGHWDRLVIDFTAHPTFLRLEQVYQHVYCRLSEEQKEILAHRDVLPEAMDLAQRMPDPISERRLQRYLRLLEHLARLGYRAEMAPNYMGIAIGRDGSPIKVSEGNHRLAAAQLLGLTRVEAEVRFVHERWFREQVTSHDHYGPMGIRTALAELNSLLEVRVPSEWGAKSPSTA